MSSKSWRDIAGLLAAQLEQAHPEPCDVHPAGDGQDCGVCELFAALRVYRAARALETGPGSSRERTARQRPPALPCGGCGVPVTWRGDARTWMALHGTGDFGHDSACPDGDGHHPATRGRATVSTLSPGDRIINGSRWAVFIIEGPHPLYHGLRLVIWKMDDGSWSFDALHRDQDVGEYVGQDSSRPRRRAALAQALLPGDAAGPDWGVPDA